MFGDGNPKGKQPTTWSEKGQFVFWAMMGPEGTAFVPNEYDSFSDFKFSENCHLYEKYSKTKIPIVASNDTNVTAENAALIANRQDEAYSYFVKNSWGTTMIPLFDMIPHRNGHWKNVEAKFVDDKGETVEMTRTKKRNGLERKDKFSTSSDENGNKLVVYAHRDIKKGEPLHVSYNQCEHLGCDALQTNFSAGEIMGDFGVVEDYPRRWSLDIDPWEEENPNSHMVFDIDRDESGKRSFKWIRKVQDVNAYASHLLSASLDRFNAVKWEILDHTANMTDSHTYERDAIIDYHKAYTEALAMAWMHRHDGVEVDAVTGEQQQDMMDGYDSLQKPKGRLAYFQGDYMNCAEGEIVDDGDLLDRVKGFYQKLEFFYEDTTDNTYMKMADTLHSASNFRLHYHESSIHVPLQYVKDVKRVAYIGGGDNMVLAEVLKYPNIELVVGMELDQQASRSSLKFFGTTPGFHDPRVQWWYGDGAKSLQIIPEEYYGSFDLVLVDLLTDHAESIKVAADLSLIDVAPLLMKQDGGVLARNEDYMDRSAISTRMTKRVVEYNYFDVPRICEQSITVGSNSVDFIHGKRYDHGIDTLVRINDFNKTAFEGWGRYHDHSRPEESSDGNKIWTTVDPVMCDKIERSLPDYEKETTLTGFLLVIEAENVTMTLENNMPEVHKKVADVAKQNGLTDVGHLYRAESDRNSAFLIFAEGYIKIQLFPDAQYVAFDLMMWGSTTHKSEQIKQSLVVAVGGGNLKGSTSSFRVTTGGMAMSEQEDNSILHNNGFVKKAHDYYCGSDSGSGTDNDEPVPAPRDDDADDAHDQQQQQPFDQSIIIPEMVAGLMNRKNRTTAPPVFAIFCGNEDAEECTSHMSIENSNSNNFTNNMTFHPVYSCESFDDMSDCESTVQQRLLTVVTENKKLDGVILDRSVSLDMGKIIHKVFNQTLNHVRLLERSFVVVAPVDKSVDESWRNILLDRFRTEMIVVAPVLKADIEIYNDTHSEEWGITSVRNDDFYSCLHKSLITIEERTGLITTTKKVLGGAKPLHFDWDPVAPKDSRFFNPEAEEQWHSQKPVAYQVLMQMELKKIKSSVSAK